MVLSPLARIQEVQDWRGGSEKGSTHYYLWYSTSKCLFPFPLTLGSLAV